MTEHVIPEGSEARLRAQKPHPLRGYILALIAACGWSTGGILSNFLMTTPGPKTAHWLIAPLGISMDAAALSGARALLSTVILGLVLLVVNRSAFKLKHPARNLLFLIPFGAIALAGMHFTYFKAIAASNVTTAILLEYLAPVVTLAYGVFILKKKVSWQMPLGALLAILGCAIVVGAFSAGGLSITVNGLVWGLLAAVFFALSSIMGGVGNDRYKPFTLLFYGLLFAAIMWIIALGPTQVLAPFTQTASALTLVFIAVISTIVPFGAYLLALQYISPTHATITAMVEPVIAALASWVLFGQKLTWSLALGGIIIIGAIVIIQLGSAPNQDEEAALHD